ADSLTLEITTTQTANGQSHDSKMTRTVAAKIDKPATSMPAGVTGEVKDMKEGKDTLEVKGAKLETTTKEFTTTATTGPGAAPTESHMKIWSSTEVPGGMVKTETASKTEMGDMKMTMTVVDYAVVK
ncbi:MAG TPA: hypothetical protein VHM90_22105, partial [Phycisphaerae bacterium]|nr:hypothetical protein [Phycisphaerae bacterium]